MRRRILIVDEDKQFTTDLWAALRKLGDYKITIARTLNEACLALIQETQALAFLPLPKDDRPVRSLLALQSDLHIILSTTGNSDTNLPDTIAHKTHGILLKDHLDTALSGIIAIIFDQIDTSLAAPNPHAAIHTGILGARVQAALLLQGQRLVTYWGKLNKAEANFIANTIHHSWTEANKTSQVQFLRQPEQGRILLLYTRIISPRRPLRDEKRYFLTLVTAPEVSLSWLRTRSDKLVSNLGNVVYSAVSLPVTKAAPATASFALAWRCYEPIPMTRIIPVRRILERVAIANACAVTFIDVQPQLIHMVIACPPDRNSGWAAHTLKSGSEEVIQHEYRHTQPLWEVGHFARESTEPLSKTELSIFLQAQS